MALFVHKFYWKFVFTLWLRWKKPRDADFCAYLCNPFWQVVDCTSQHRFSRLQYKPFHDSVCWFLVFLLLLRHLLMKMQVSQIINRKGFSSLVCRICSISIVTSALWSDSNSWIFNCVIFLSKMIDTCSTYYFDNFTRKLWCICLILLLILFSSSY